MKCEYCEYDCEPRKSNPKSCPRCKRRFDYPSNTESVATEPIAIENEE